MGLVACGALILLFALSAFGRCLIAGHRCDNLPDVGTCLFGIALIFSPFFAVSGLIGYLLIITMLVGPPIVGAYIGLHFGGKGSWLIGLGLAAGFALGYATAVSKWFHRFLDTLTATVRIRDDY